MTLLFGTQPPPVKYCTLPSHLYLFLSALALSGVCPEKHALVLHNISVTLSLTTSCLSQISFLSLSCCCVYVQDVLFWGGEEKAGTVSDLAGWGIWASWGRAAKGPHLSLINGHTGSQHCEQAILNLSKAGTNPFTHILRNNHRTSPVNQPGRRRWVGHRAEREWETRPCFIAQERSISERFQNYNQKKTTLVH